jgi:hypothetical protein
MELLLATCNGTTVTGEPGRIKDHNGAETRKAAAVAVEQRPRRLRHGGGLIVSIGVLLPQAGG